MANETDLMSMVLTNGEKSLTSTNLKLPRSNSGVNVKWDDVTFDEKQSMYLLTLLGMLYQSIIYFYRMKV